LCQTETFIFKDGANANNYKFIDLRYILQKSSALAPPLDIYSSKSQNVMLLAGVKEWFKVDRGCAI